MCARARERELGIFDHSGRQPRAERRRLHPGDRIGVGEDHLGGDAVGVHLLVALLRVERAAQPFFVLGLPVRDVVVVELHLLVAVGLPFGEEVVEGGVVPHVEIRPVLVAGQPRVRVGGDDEVPAVHRVVHGGSALLTQHRQVVVALVHVR